jgi:hypothetical protein
VSAIESPQRRKSTRVRSLKGARISYKNGAFTVDCTVRDMSPEGARLKLGGFLAIPNRFTLRFEDDGSERQCEVRWRTDKEIGIAFV